jgi:4-hydroxy-tetrahydrodipicolinate synthase
MKDFSGVFTALVTPFKNGAIDWPSMKRLVRQQLDGGVNGFVISGTTAESPTLSLEEKQKIFSFVKQESGGAVPLVVGTGTNSTSESIHLTSEAAKWGADAALVVVPYYNKPPQRGLFQHFQKISECSSLPVILYNVPGRTITKLEAQTIVELSHLRGIIGIKDATGDVAFGAELVRECPPDFMVSSGDDGTFLDLVAAGGQGVISVAAHLFPKEFSSWCRRARSGENVIHEFERIVELNNYLYVEANPIPVKMALHLMGIIDSPELRLPMVQLSEAFTLELKDKMKQAELL